MTNFWKALESVDMSQPIVNHEYRLYYNKDTGKPLFFTVEKPEGAFIVVDKERYATGTMDFKVVDGKIKYPETVKYKLLKQTDKGTPCHPDNVMIVDKNSTLSWSLKTYYIE